MKYARPTATMASVIPNITRMSASHHTQVRLVPTGPATRGPHSPTLVEPVQKHRVGGQAHLRLTPPDQHRPHDPRRTQLHDRFCAVVPPDRQFVHGPRSEQSAGGLSPPVTNRAVKVLYHRTDPGIRGRGTSRQPRQERYRRRDRGHYRYGLPPRSSPVHRRQLPLDRSYHPSERRPIAVETPLEAVSDAAALSVLR
jgi:hypothetical protein